MINWVFLLVLNVDYFCYVYNRKGSTMKKKYIEVSIDLIKIDGDVVVASPTTTAYSTSPEPTAY